MVNISGNPSVLKEEVSWFVSELLLARLWHHTQFPQGNTMTNFRPNSQLKNYGYIYLYLCLIRQYPLLVAQGVDNVMQCKQIKFTEFSTGFKPGG